MEEREEGEKECLKYGWMLEKKVENIPYYSPSVLKMHVKTRPVILNVWFTFLCENYKNPNNKTMQRKKT